MIFLFFILYLIIGAIIFTLIYSLTDINLDNKTIIIIALGSIFWIITLPITFIIYVLYKLS